MMKKILVSLVSEQTIPNILMALHHRPDILWFLSTKKMEELNKRIAIEDTLRLSGFSCPSKYVEVDQDSLEDCIKKIESLVESVEGEVEYIINLTGGTKVMALAAYEIFREIGQKVSIHYMPLGKNDIIQIFPRKKEFKIYEVKKRLNLAEYLCSYSFKIQNKDKLQEASEAALRRRHISELLLHEYEQLKGLLGLFYKELADKRKQRQYNLSTTYGKTLSHTERHLLEMMHFRVTERNTISKDLVKDEIVFLTGGWLEEYVYNEIYTLVKEDLIDEAKLGVVIEDLQGSVNELDIAVVKNNTFYHIECKTLADKAEHIISDEVYKKGVISSLLGKGEKRAMICTTLEKINNSLKKRGDGYGVEVFTLSQTTDIKNILKARFGAKHV